MQGEFRLYGSFRERGRTFRQYTEGQAGRRELLRSFVTEQTAILRRVVWAQRRFTSGAVAIIAELFRFLFIHGQETAMVFIRRQHGRGFLGCIPEKQKNCDAYADKQAIIEPYFFAFRLCIFRFLRHTHPRYSESSELSCQRYIFSRYEICFETLSLYPSRLEFIP